MNWLQHTKTSSPDPRDIDLDDTTYYIPCFADLEPLEQSVRAVGIITQPVVQERVAGSPVPVLGRRRLTVARRVGLPQVEVKVLPARMPEQDAFRLAFWDNVTHRTFDPACTSVVVRRLLELFPRDAVAEEFLPVMGVPPRGPRLERLRIVAGLEPFVLESLASGRIHEKTCVILARLAPAERAILMQITEELGLNANKKNEIISSLVDLSIFHSRPVVDLLQDECAAAILSDRDAALPERAARFRDLVRSWKHPELAAQEQEFHSWRQSVVRSNRVTIRHAQGFETPECTLEIRCDSRQHAQRIIDRLDDEA
ncbi:MAG: hypothetical protein HY914_16610 [Desulfomonile tiedjei]|nr:hypothetical protein [Desulfomonile tiedjei]